LVGDVEIAEDVIVDPFVYVEGPARIGARSHLYPSCVVGTPPEHKRAGPQGCIVIGTDTTLRELVVVQRGTGEHDTTIGSRCLLMDHVHVAHDCLVEDEVTIAPNAVLGGHSHVLRGANLGMLVAIHQFSTVGAFAMVGMGSVVTRDVPPFCLVLGNPARFQRWNTVALIAQGISTEDLRISDGGMLSEQPKVQAALAHFSAHARRKRMPLAPASDD
jgi:UDP-N-acetylglucosamine acyltransferase